MKMLFCFHILVYYLSKNLLKTVFLKGASSSSSSLSDFKCMFRAHRIMELTCILNLALSMKVSVSIFLNSFSVLSLSFVL